MTTAAQWTAGKVRARRIFRRSNEPEAGAAPQVGVAPHAGGAPHIRGAGEALRLQRQVGNRAVTRLVAQRQPAPKPEPAGEAYVEPSEKWYAVNDAYHKQFTEIGNVNQAAPAVTRSQWLNQLESAWRQIGAPGEKTDTELMFLMVPLYELQRKIKIETTQARQNWARLIERHKAEMIRLRANPDIDPLAQKYLDDRFNETLRVVVKAGDLLVDEDLGRLQSMLDNNTHIQWVSERKMREEEDKRQQEERDERHKLKYYALSETQLLEQVNGLRAKIDTLKEDSPEAASIREHLALLEGELRARKHPAYAPDSGAYPHEVALFSSYLVRGGYITQLNALLPAAWAKMSQAELTAFLAAKFSEEELKTMFLAKYDERMAIKSRFRKLNIISALVIGLIWARDNIKEGEWTEAAMKVGATGVSAYAFNALLYARDKSPQALMAAKAGDYGRWFQGAARSNPTVNFLARRLAPALAIWSIKDIFMSGGADGPNIPFDIIQTIDINDPSTWEPPSQTLLDLGFNIWYRQACTPEFKEACGPDYYISKVEGSFTRGLLTFMDIGPHRMDHLKDNLYRIEGDYDITDLFVARWVHRRVSASENVLVVATGQMSGSKTGGMGHYRDYQVYPANVAAVKLFGSPQPRWVNSNLLRPVNLKDEK